ncbi:MAG: hypothetical protein ACI31G_01495 [Bacilli bacterium]
MKKEDILGMIAYLLILGIAAIFTFTVLQKHATYANMDTFVYAMFVLGAFVTGIILNSILYELAHALGAKIGGYKVLSLNILGFCFYRENKNEKMKFKFSSFDGLTGETKIVPLENYKKEPNPKPFLLLGSLFFIIEIIPIIVYFTVSLNYKNNPILLNSAYFLLVIGVSGFLILFYNILPFRLDTVTDGYRLTMVSNPKNKEAFNELLRVEYELSQGNSNIEVKTFETITNFTADLNLNKVYALFENKKYSEAEKLLDIIIEGKANISEKVYLRARAQKIYINIMSKPFEEAKAYYDNDVSPQERRKISNDISLPAIRAYLLMSGLFDKSKSETLIALNNVMKAYKNTPKNRRQIEITLFNDALNKVIEAHPTWELENYLLVANEDKK